MKLSHPLVASLLPILLLCSGCQQDVSGPKVARACSGKLFDISIDVKYPAGAPILTTRLDIEGVGHVPVTLDTGTPENYFLSRDKSYDAHPNMITDYKTVKIDQFGDKVTFGVRGIPDSLGKSMMAAASIVSRHAMIAST